MKKHQSKKDPVCGKRINRNKAHIVIKYKGHEHLVCCSMCQAEFERSPDRYTLTSARR